MRERAHERGEGQREEQTPCLVGSLLLTPLVHALSLYQISKIFF